MGYAEEKDDLRIDRIRTAKTQNQPATNPDLHPDPCTRPHDPNSHCDCHHRNLALQGVLFEQSP